MVSEVHVCSVHVKCDWICQKLQFDWSAVTVAFLTCQMFMSAQAFFKINGPGWLGHAVTLLEITT